MICEVEELLQQSEIKKYSLSTTLLHEQEDKEQLLWPSSIKSNRAVEADMVSLTDQTPYSSDKI